MVTRTTEGNLVSAGVADGKQITPFTPEQAAADASQRNERAKSLGIATRYVTADE